MNRFLMGPPHRKQAGFITGQIPYVALPNVTGSGLACGTGNRLHHWTDSLCGPPQCDREWASMWHGKQASSLDRFLMWPSPM